jgi:uncharacterized protein YyaL (SSP411 family)
MYYMKLPLLVATVFLSLLINHALAATNSATNATAKTAATNDLPKTPVSESPQLLEQLRSALTALGPDYKPRTEHFGDNQQPVYINRLILERSPYLLQHAHNPVNWFPWGEEAFSRAKETNKPIFLSVGYATCHWCHVMERQSFESEEIARYMNEYFITVKVDREQRPDVDSTFMTAVQMLTGSGGWPMSVFLTPDGKPFFGGTYFPPDQFEDLLKRVDQVWLTNQQDLEAEAEKISTALASLNENQGTAKTVGQQVVEDGIARLLESFDNFEGGFGSAPKFPRAPMLFLLLSEAQRSGDAAVIEALDFTLRSIAAGGIHDQIGGGFHRYAVDNSWLIPHFEKMLYNQALMARLYTQTFLLTGKAEHARTARRTLDYVLREMRSTQGGFYSATDADSDGGEGLFFIWQEEEIDRLLGDDAAFAKRVWNITAEGNFEDSNILHLVDSHETLADEFGLSMSEFTKKLDAVGQVLLDHRATRAPPLLDDKILTGWNGLVITALAQAGMHLQNTMYIDEAIAAAEFLLEHNIREVQHSKMPRLYRSYYLDSASIDATLSDYAYLAEGLIALYDATQNTKWLQQAQQFMNVMDADFKDENNGGYFMGSSATAGVTLPTRPKELYDNSIPSGNAAALRVLVQLWHRTGDFAYQNAANELISAFSHTLTEMPDSMGYMVKSTDELMRGETGSLRYTGFGKVRASASVDIHNKLTVAIDIAPGWHINSESPKQKNLIATALTDMQGNPLPNTQYPQEKLTKLSFEKSVLSLYDGAIKITADLPTGNQSDASSSNSGTEPSDHVTSLYPVLLQVQTCSDEICLAPETLQISVPTVAIEHLATR